ncbi:hypothetical protein MMC07_004041 [Pseudocyphellaria aurata]|nr:hypothetical protein [Pseudocyphellaria aurata]
MTDASNARWVALKARMDASTQRFDRHYANANANAKRPFETHCVSDHTTPHIFATCSAARCRPVPKPRHPRRNPYWSARPKEPSVPISDDDENVLKSDRLDKYCVIIIQTLFYIQGVSRSEITRRLMEAFPNLCRERHATEESRAAVISTEVKLSTSKRSRILVNTRLPYF